MATTAVPSTVPIPTFVTGDRVSYRKQPGTFVCGDNRVATINFDKGGMKAWIPIGELKRISPKKT